MYIEKYSKSREEARLSFPPIRGRGPAIGFALTPE